MVKPINMCIVLILYHGMRIILSFELSYGIRAITKDQTKFDSHGLFHFFFIKKNKNPSLNLILLLNSFISPQALC